MRALFTCAAVLLFAVGGAPLGWVYASNAYHTNLNKNLKVGLEA